jgi:hypothetical protein
VPLLQQLVVYEMVSNSSGPSAESLTHGFGEVLFRKAACSVVVNQDSVVNDFGDYSGDSQDTHKHAPSRKRAERGL